ncbi:MAG: hypothetical protein GY803_06715 [Chloroflexi bacterium]|nr:hypothetical protein [Chloroflexota bacterium]
MSNSARWLRWAAGLLAGTAVLAVILILSGVFDPQPAGALQWERPLTPQTVPAHSSQIVWIDQIAPEPPYSVRLTAAHNSGETDIVYGLALGGDNAYAGFAVSPLGYAAVWESHSAIRNPRLRVVVHSAFRPWPHVRQGDNEIWVDVTEETVAARVNRELLWTGETAVDSGRIGLLAESFGETAVIDFQSVEFFAAK